MRTYAIGDLHGRFDLLSMALSAAEADAGDRAAVFVVCGDFIDRGPQSRSIIELLMQGATLPNWRWIVLKGNHEDMMVQCLRQPQRLRWWLGNGGGATMASYGYAHGDELHPLRVPVEHLAWLDALPVYHIDEHRAFVHAGFDPGKPLAEQSTEHMLWMRAPRGDDYAYAGRHVVHGHEQFADGPVLTANKSNLDTLAWWTGRLVVAAFNDDEPGGPVDLIPIIGKAA